MRDTGEEERKQSEKIKGQKNDHPRKRRDRRREVVLTAESIETKAFQ